MLKVALIGGLLTALSISGFSLGSLFLGVIGVGVGLLVLSLALEIFAGVFERIGRRWVGGIQHGYSVRLQRTRPMS